MIHNQSIADDVFVIFGEVAADAGYTGKIELYSRVGDLGLDWLDRAQLLDRIEAHFSVWFEDEPDAAHAATVSDWIEMVANALQRQRLMNGATIDEINRADRG